MFSITGRDGKRQREKEEHNKITMEAKITLFMNINPSIDC